jgi:hypothetical protein
MVNCRQEGTNYKVCLTADIPSRSILRQGANFESNRRLALYRLRDKGPAGPNNMPNVDHRLSGRYYIFAESCTDQQVKTGELYSLTFQWIKPSSPSKGFWQIIRNVSSYRRQWLRPMPWSSLFRVHNGLAEVRTK